MKLNIERVDLKDLISPEFNPRQISKTELEKLKKSITEFGYIEPIIVNRYNNHIIGGNQRAKVLAELGEKKIDVVYVDIDNTEQEKVASIALNKIGGEWDENKLTEIFKELKIEGFDLDLTGFTDLELENFIDDDLELDLNIDGDELEILKDNIPTKKVEEIKEEQQVSEESTPIEETKTVVTEKTVTKSTNNEEQKPKSENKLVKKEINITEEYIPSNNEDNLVDEENEDEYKEEIQIEDIPKETKQKTVKKEYVKTPNDPIEEQHMKSKRTIPTPDYLPIAPIKRIIKDAGAERVSDDAGKLLGLVLEENAKQISEKAVMMANVAGRKTLYAEDFEIILNS